MSPERQDEGRKLTEAFARYYADSISQEARAEAIASADFDYRAKMDWSAYLRRVQQLMKLGAKDTEDTWPITVPGWMGLDPTNPYALRDQPVRAAVIEELRKLVESPSPIADIVDMSPKELWISASPSIGLRFLARCARRFGRGSGQTCSRCASSPKSRATSNLHCLGELVPT